MSYSNFTFTQSETLASHGNGMDGTSNDSRCLHFGVELILTCVLHTDVNALASLRCQTFWQWVLI